MALLLLMGDGLRPSNPRSTLTVAFIGGAQLANPHKFRPLN